MIATPFFCERERENQEQEYSMPLSLSPSFLDRFYGCFMALGRNIKQRKQ